jgi:hypothetical protein
MSTRPARPSPLIASTNKGCEKYHGRNRSFENEGEVMVGNEAWVIGICVQQLSLHDAAVNVNNFTWKPLRSAVADAAAAA